MTLLDFDGCCDGMLLSSCTLRVWMLYRATVVVPLGGLVRWDGGDWERGEYFLSIDADGYISRAAGCIYSGISASG